MPALRVYLPSVAPVDMVATRGTPGQLIVKILFIAWVSSGSSGEGGTATTGTGFPSGSVCDTMLIFTFGSLATRSRVLRISCGSSPGKMRQLTLARAVCGSALGAWPPESIVATHVVCSKEL